MHKSSLAKETFHSKWSFSLSPKKRSRFVEEANRIKFIFITIVMGATFSVATWTLIFFPLHSVVLVNRFSKANHIKCNAREIVRNFHLVVIDMVKMCPKEKVIFLLFSKKKERFSAFFEAILCNIKTVLSVHGGNKESLSLNWHSKCVWNLRTIERLNYVIHATFLSNW